MKIKIFLALAILASSFKDFVLVNAKPVQNVTEEINFESLRNCSRVNFVDECQTEEEGETVKK